MSISAKIKRYYGQSRTDLSREQHTPEPERNSNSNSHNSTTNNTSHSHNFSPVFISFPYADHEQTEPLAGPSTRPILEGLSKQLEALQSQFKVPGAETEAEDNLGDSDEIPLIPSAPPIFPHSSRPRQGMGVRDSSPQTPRTVRPEFSAKRKGKRRQDALKPPEPEPENDRLVVDDRTRKEKETTDNFYYFLYFLAFCALIFFLIFLFLLTVLFLFCLYVFHLSYK